MPITFYLHFHKHAKLFPNLPCFLFFFFYCTTLSTNFSSFPSCTLPILSLGPPFPILKFCFYFDLISSHEKLLPGLKQSTRKNPSGRHPHENTTLEDASSMLLCSTVLTITSIQPQIALSLDHRPLFQIECKALWSYNSMPCWTPTTIQILHFPTHIFHAIYNILYLHLVRANFNEYRLCL